MKLLQKTRGWLARRLERIVMYFIAWRKRDRARRLYYRLWKANDILLIERHGWPSKENSDYYSELDDCTTEIMRLINKVKAAYKT